MTDLSETSQKLLDQLLYGSDPEKEAALGELPHLPDKDLVADALAKRLPGEEDGRLRSWMISGLGAINQPGTAALVAERLDPTLEDDGWARYWAAIALNRMQPADLEAHLLQAKKDPDALVAFLAARLLVENGHEEEHLDQLLDGAANKKHWDSRWAACKALRSDAGKKPFRQGIERKIIPILTGRLRDDREVMDVRFQAALALGTISHQWQEAVQALGQALTQSLPDWVRRGCLDALAHINRPETRDALLVAVRDSDAEIRVRAARALKHTLGPAGAVGFLVEELLKHEALPAEFFDALRQIDNKTSADVLANHLLHPDPALAERASRALARLGGEQAMRTLQAQRAKAVETYTSLLNDADKQIMKQFESLMSKALQAFSLSMWMHGIIFVVGVLALGASLWVAFNSGFEIFERYVGVGAAAGSLGTLLLLFYRDPLKNIRESVTNLVKVNVVFLGYVRQINQIDASFKQMFLEPGGFGVEQMRPTVEQIQDSVKKTMEEVRGFLEAGGAAPGP